VDNFMRLCDGDVPLEKKSFNNQKNGNLLKNLHCTNFRNSDAFPIISYIF
jgi:hypothetical protein